ncbi:MAG: WYL domain-containing protein [Candidatus Promineifilaceae bacterium]
MTRLATRTSRLRQLEELLLLNPDGLKATELAEALYVDRRTIYRDIDFLSEEGVPVWQKDGRFGINRTRYLPAVHLTFHEAIAMVLAGLLLSRTIDSNNPHVVSALRKLATTLPRPFTEHLIRAADRVEKHGNHRQRVLVLETIAEGWGNTQKVKVGYRSPRSGELRERVLSPYALEPTPSGIYVIGHDEYSNDLRTFKLDRLESAKLMRERFDIPDDFNLDERLTNSWRIMNGEAPCEVALRFQPEATPHVLERQWHPSQKIHKLTDGRCLLKLQIAAPQEMKPWIRSWGAQVEVLSPQWLRDEIRQELALAARSYETV